MKLFSAVPSDKSRANGHKLKHRGLVLNTRNGGVTENRAQVEAVQSPTLGIL